MNSKSARRPGRNATVTNRPRSIVRRLFHSAFVHAVDKSKLSQARIARQLQTSPSVVRDYLRGKHRIDLERVGTSMKLWPHFLRCLVVLERKARVI